MILLLVSLALISFFGYITADKILYININKLTSYDPLKSQSSYNKQTLKNFSKLFTVQDKKWNKRLRILFGFTIVLYFNFISIVIYEIIQYEHSDSLKLIDSDEELHQDFIINYCIPTMLKLMSVLLSVFIPFIIIFLGLQKFNLVKTLKQLITFTVLLTCVCYQIIVNNVINLDNQKASILLKLGVIGMIFMSSLSSIGCVITTYYHYFLKNNNKLSNIAINTNHTTDNIFVLVQKIYNDPKKTILYSSVMDIIFLYYCNFKNFVTLFFKIPKSIANLDIIYGLNKITTDKKNDANPMVTTIINVINFFYYTGDEKIDQIFMVKLISISLSFSLFLLCFSYILSFLRNGLNIIIYYFDLNKDNELDEKPAGTELPRFNHMPPQINNPSHIKNFIFAEFVGIYIVATTLVILKLFLPAEFEEYMSNKIFKNWMTINVVKSQSKLIDTSSSGNTSAISEMINWFISIPQFPLLNKLVLIKSNNLAIFDNVQSIFDITFQVTWFVLVLGIFAFEIYSSKILGNDDHLMISLIADKYTTISRSNSASNLYMNVKKSINI